jgi:hypothetical protein
MVKPTMKLDEYRALVSGRKVSQHKAGEMNNLERRYAMEKLEPLKLAGIIFDYYFEAVTLKLAKDTRYTPDFFVVLYDGAIQCHEVKGFWRDDAKVKIKVAAEKFKHFIFIAAQRLPKKQGGDWIIKYF